MQEHYCVYMHTCPNHKVYIGITGRNPLVRWNSGKGYQQQQLFYNAILKYGWDNIKHEILFSGLSKEEACKIEREQIALHKSNVREFGYNMSDGGDCTAQGVNHFIGFEKDGFTVVGSSDGKLLLQCGKCGKIIARYHSALTQKHHIKCECMKSKRPEPKKYVMIEYRGKVQSAAEWARETGICRDTIMRRLNAGYSSDEIFEMPVKKHRTQEKMIHYCERCGKPFKQSKNRTRYCSAECYSASRPKRPIVKCVTCGREFEGRTWRKEKYCSMECRNADWHNAHGK